MLINFFKKTAIVSIMFVFLLSIALTTNKVVNAKSLANIRYIVTSVGESETSVGINFHTDVTGAKVIYGKDKYVTDGVEVEATTREWHFDRTGTDTSYGMASRYVNNVDLTNLDENTTYYYKVVCGEESSTIKSFKTSSKNVTTQSFMWTTDTHVASDSYATNSNQIMEKVLAKDSNVDYVVITGDLIDRGGIENHWASFFKGQTALLGKKIASIPGNHEHYLSESSSYVSAEIYNQFFNNPDNGADCRKNSSYYFKNGNVLVIMLDTIKMSDTKAVIEQKAWFKQVVLDNPTQWIIVGTHAGGISAGAYASDASWIRNNWQSTFEECQVDLALSGHEHVYIRKDNAYKSSFDDDRGVTYIVGPSGGHKSYATMAKPVEGQTYRKMDTFGASLIKVTDKTLTVTFYDKEGTVPTDVNNDPCTVTLQAKRPAVIQEFTEEEIKNSIKLDYQEEDSTGIINWAPELYGNAYKVVVTRNTGEFTATYESLVPSGKYSYISVYPLFYNNNHKLTVEVFDKDSKLLATKEFEIINRPPFNLTLNVNGGILENDLQVYLSGNTTVLPIPTKEGYDFLGWFDNENFTGDAKEEITPELTGELSYYAKWGKKYKLDLQTNGGDITVIVPTTHTHGLDLELPEPTKKGYVFAGWYDNDKLSGNPMSIVSKDCEEDLTLYAKWLKKYRVILSLEGGDLDKDLRISEYIEESIVNLPTPTKENCVFDGWYSEPDYSGQQVEMISSATTDIILYAKWCGIYTINYVLNNGRFEGEYPTTYVEGKELVLPTPVGLSVYFGGWHLQQDLSDESFTSLPTTLSGEITLYAKWNRDYSIFYRLNGGKLTDKVETYREGSTTTLPNPTKDKFIFEGWYLTKDFSGEKIVEISKLASGDITLYAKWSKKGCKNGTMIIIELLASVSLAYVLIKKKH